jgi:porphobilinogen synthase
VNRLARRMRRLRRTAALRSLVRETRLAATDLVQPLFVVEDPNDAGAADSMPGVRRHTLDALPAQIEAVASSGVPAVLLFGVPCEKDDVGSQACAEDGIAARAIRAAKCAVSQVAVIADVCLCSYTDHGHCGVVHGRDGVVDNDATLPLLARAATVYAGAGADLVAPSAMMDGMVAAIRNALDDAGCHEVGILSYAVKYASSLYGPFRSAAACAPRFGDRRSYQMNPANRREALAEAEQDVAEGADALMVKPALFYLDVIRTLRDAFPQAPLAAYQVSGEYSMIRAAGAAGWLDERSAVLESLLAIKRAGADVIISYFATHAARLLGEQERGWHSRVGRAEVPDRQEARQASLERP